MAYSISYHKGIQTLKDFFIPILHQLVNARQAFFLPQSLQYPRRDIPQRPEVCPVIH